MEEKQFIKEKNNDTELEGISDLVMIFIGASLIVLGILNMFAEIPSAFILGATLSGLFFTFSDPSIYSQQLSNDSRQVLSFFMTALAVFSFFLLPVVLLISPNLYEMFKPYGDLATFVALGAVIIVFGVKSRKANRSRIEKLIIEREQFDTFKKELIQLIEKDTKSKELELAEIMQKSTRLDKEKYRNKNQHKNQPSDE